MENQTSRENWLSIKIKAGGTTPRQHPILSIGATFVDNPYNSFYCEMIPVPYKFVPHLVQEAFPQEIPAKAMHRLAETGKTIIDCINNFVGWLYSNTVHDEKIVLVSWRAYHDWSFLDYMFAETNITNPFSSHGIIDLKTMWMIHQNLQWTDVPSTMPNTEVFKPSAKIDTGQAELEAIEQTHIATKVRNKNSHSLTKSSRIQYNIMK